MNIYDNTAFPLRQHTDKSEDEISEIVNRRLQEVGLAEAHYKMPERARVAASAPAFARALVLDPAIVFDEPDSGLDPVRTALLCELIREVHEENGGCYMVISHDLGPPAGSGRLHRRAVEGPHRRVGSERGALFNSDNDFVRQSQRRGRRPPGHGLTLVGLELRARRHRLACGLAATAPDSSSARRP